MSSEQQRQQGQVTHCGEDQEISSVYSVDAGKQRHGQNHNQNGLLVHMPSAEEAAPAAYCETSDELLDIARAGPQPGQGGHPENNGEDHCGQGRDVRKHRVMNILHQAPGHAALAAHIRDGETQPSADDDQDLVDNIVDSPEVGSPVRVAEASLEREEPGDHIREIIWSIC